MEKYGYIYKCTLLPTQKIYIGKKKSAKFLNHYYGSGSDWNHIISKYKKSEIKREILQWCYSEDELNRAEMYWIEKLNSTNSDIGYNVSFGGIGGVIGERNGAYNKHWYTDGVNSVFCEECPEGFYPGTGSLINDGRNEKLKNCHRTIEQKEHYRQSKLGDKNPMKRCTGVNHPNYGKKCYISPDGETSKYFKLGEEPTGWVQGMKYNLTKDKNGENNPAYGKHFYNNGVIQVLAYECPYGFVSGRLKRKGG